MSEIPTEPREPQERERGKGSPAPAELAEQIAELRGALEGAVEVLASAGYTAPAYCELEEAERASPAWRAVRRAWKAIGANPDYLLLYSRDGRRVVRTFATADAALNAALETLEMNEGYPESIETEGGVQLMGCAEILRVWGDRHDPG